jgi:tetratricopeptide (TPR) repeat protein
MCCIRVLGPNHLHTAQVYMDFGRLQNKLNNKEEALSCFEKAYLIYESAFGGISKLRINIFSERHALSTGSAAFQLAEILEGQRRFQQAYDYSVKAAEIYLYLHGKHDEMYIYCLWKVICILYSLQKKPTPMVYSFIPHLLNIS